VSGEPWESWQPYYAIGDFDRAVEYLDRALRTLPSIGEKTNASLETLAKILLTQNRFDDCGELLDRIGSSIQSPKDAVLYAHRCAELTRTHLMARRGRTDDALAHSGIVLNLATCAGDALLSLMGLLTRAELLQQVGRTSEALAILDAAIPDLSGQSPDLYAHAERILAVALAGEGLLEAGGAHYQRARRSTPRCIACPANWSWIGAGRRQRRSGLRRNRGTNGQACRP